MPAIGRSEATTARRSLTIAEEPETRWGRSARSPRTMSDPCPLPANRIDAGPEADALAARRRPQIQVPATDEFRGWLARLSESVRLPATTVVEFALLGYAKTVGFDEPAPKR